jgi:CubicO group peptidase (beta-lactamase class C family)
LFDLASLAKPLVTAPLAHERLDLDQDRRRQLGFGDRPAPLTVRQLLSHSSGLPPWLPFTGEPLALQLRRVAAGAGHPKLRPGPVGTARYSDLGYRLLAELLELETGRPFPELGAATSGLSPAPWAEAPPFAPQGLDAQLWAEAEPGLVMPARDPHRPNDANARAGMAGHAGFGAGPAQFEQALRHWLLRPGGPARMAVATAESGDGERWGLGLQVAGLGPGRFGQLLAAIPLGQGGVRVLVREDPALSPAAPVLGVQGAASDFWFHLGYTGPALFWRPADGLCLALLCHRLGPEGELLDAEQLRARRWEMLAGAVRTGDR